MSRTKVTLREKKISNGRLSLYLDYYPPILNADGKRTRREFLGIHIYQNPKNATQKSDNKEKSIVAHQIRDQRNIQLINREYGFKDNIVYKVKLKDIYNEVLDKILNRNSRSNYMSWQASFKIFKGYFKDMLSNELTGEDIEFYRKHVLNYVSQKTKKKISSSTAHTYFKHFLYVLKYAYKKNMFKNNLAEGVEHISFESEPREYLNHDEIEALNNATVQDSVVKDICFLILLTGKRFVEINNLCWRQIQQNTNGEYYLKIKETKDVKNYNHPISDEAYSYLKKQPKKREKIFDVSYSKAYRILKLWIKEAKIDKKIGFHNFRHTYATLQLENNTDIYTVSKLLAHKNIKTTEIYAKVTDKKKSESTNKIKIKRDES